MVPNASRVFARLSIGLFAAVVGAMSGALAQAISNYQGAYRGSPGIWAAGGALIGFLIGTCCGNRSLTGRPASLVSGLVAGIAIGALLGWGWSRIEFELDRRHLLAEGIPARHVDGDKSGLFAGAYEGIGLRYGSGLGIVAGLAGGFCRQRNLRSNHAAQLVVALALGSLIFGAVSMSREFHRLSNENLPDIREWSEFLRDRSF